MLNTFELLNLDNDWLTRKVLSCVLTIFIFSYVVRASWRDLRSSWMTFIYELAFGHLVFLLYFWFSWFETSAAYNHHVFYWIWRTSPPTRTSWPWGILPFLACQLSRHYSYQWSSTFSWSAHRSVSSYRQPWIWCSLQPRFFQDCQNCRRRGWSRSSRLRRGFGFRAISQSRTGTLLNYHWECARPSCHQHASYTACVKQASGCADSIFINVRLYPWTLLTSVQVVYLTLHAAIYYSHCRQHPQTSQIPFSTSLIMSQVLHNLFNDW